MAAKTAGAILLVAPSDHLIPDIDLFHKAVATGLEEVGRGNLVIFGIEPAGPETGYGYLKLREADTGKAAPVEAFIEKPDIAKAREMLAQDSYFWNAGIFLFRARDMIEAFQTHCKGQVEAVSGAIENGIKDLDFLRLDEEAWDGCEQISLDHAIIERVSNLYAVKYSAQWSDLGSWTAIENETVSGKLDQAGANPVTAIDCENAYLRSESPDLQLVGFGLKDVIAIAMQDAVLVMDKAKTQDVGKVVKNLQKKNVSQAESFPWEHRPWGRFEVLTEQPGFKVKRIVVKPGGILSLQKHERRSEHWVVVKGTAKATVNADERILKGGESVYVPVGAVHRLENPGDDPMIMIEVQTGDYLGEDDIIRFEDVYARN